MRCCVTSELRDEILPIISATPHQSFAVPRLFSYCAQYILHSGWYPDYVARLFRRGKARFTDDLVHERLLTQGPSAKLKSPLVHLIFPDFESVIDKVNRYSTVGAVSLSMKGRSAILLGALVRGMRAAFRNYVLRR